MGIWHKESFLRYCITPRILILGMVPLMMAGILIIFEYIARNIIELLNYDVKVNFRQAIVIMCMLAGLTFLIAIIEYIFRRDEIIIKYQVLRRLCDSSFGNPLHLKEGEIEPYITVGKTDKGYRITVDCQSAKFDDVSSLSTAISGCLRGKFENYAVVSKEEDIAGRYVDYYIEDVVSSYYKQSVYTSLDDVPLHLSRIYIREDVYIDYSRVLNSSAIIAGKSRSGKTTAIISSFLLPMLKQGRDDYGSKIIIVDPKSAELSLCPYVLSPAPDGSVEHILDAIRDFNKLRIKRQKIINGFCKSEGKAVKWLDVGMKPCVIFLDEFVSIQDMFPKKASKEKPDYSLADFQGLLRQIATQGASAGFFLILSTAEASVGTGGLETAVNNACGIRILFKPSINEARYLWNSETLDVLRERQYSAGDAWFSADDGLNNSVRFVKFPKLEFGEYEALSALLQHYYEDADTSNSVKLADTDSEGASDVVAPQPVATGEARELQGEEHEVNERRS